MCTLLDHSSVIFKFPSLRFNFYQGPSNRRGNLSRQIFSSETFFSLLRWHLLSPLCTNFFIIKTRSGVGELSLPSLVVITKQFHTKLRFLFKIVVFLVYSAKIFIIFYSHSKPIISTHTYCLYGMIINGNGSIF